MQILVRLSVLPHTTAPLRANQKYVYREKKLHVYKITRYTKHSDLYTFLYQRLTKALQKVPFYAAKGRLSHLKRAPFTMRKGIFYFTKNHLPFPIYESLLQPFLCPFPFHNKRVSLPPHYYNNTIKTTTFQFSCHSRHSSPRPNALITSILCEMLKVTATKNKNYVRVLE